MNDLIGVYDGDGKTWCIQCWAGKSEVSTNQIRLGDENVGRCTGCGVWPCDVDRAPIPKVRVILDGDDCWPDLAAIDKAGNLIHLNAPKLLAFARLTNGVKSGASSVSIRIDLPGDQVILIETTMKLFLHVADLFRRAEGA